MTTTLADLNTPALVDAAQHGDRDAFAQLYTAHQKLVYDVIYTRVRNPTITKDLRAETFARVWAKLHTYQGGNFTGWVRTIACNITLDHIKASSTRNETTVDMTTWQWLAIHNPADNPETIHLSAWETATIRHAIAGIPLSLSNAATRLVPIRDSPELRDLKIQLRAAGIDGIPA